MESKERQYQERKFHGLGSLTGLRTQRHTTPSDGSMPRTVRTQALPTLAGLMTSSGSAMCQCPPSRPIYAPRQMAAPNSSCHSGANAASPIPFTATQRLARRDGGQWILNHKKWEKLTGSFVTRRRLLPLRGKNQDSIESREEKSLRARFRKSRVWPLRSGTSMAGARISAPATGALVFHLLLTSDGSAAVDQLGEQGLVENNQFLPDRVLPPSWH